MASFQAFALDRNPFAHLFALSDEEVLAQGAKRHIANKRPGFPCRLSLQDAEIGEEVILATYQHIGGSPFAATGPIFVRKAAIRAEPEPNVVPQFLESRLISLRAYDGQGLIVDADVVPGSEIKARLEGLFEAKGVAHIQAHFARPGCYACRFERI